MVRNDRFLLAILVGAAALVAVALGLARRAGPPEYQAEATPEGVAFNYLLALQRRDVARAFGYLSPTLPGYPETVEQFEEDLSDWGGMYVEPATAYRPDGAQLWGDPISGERATVSILETTFHEGGLFGSSEFSSRLEYRLLRHEGIWRLVDGDRFWYHCWIQPQNCPRREPAPAGEPAPEAAPTPTELPPS